MKQPGPRESSGQESTFLKPMDVKRLARVPYRTVLQWLTVGHPRAGILPSYDLSTNGKRHSYRIRLEDWEEFLTKLQTMPKERQRFRPLSRPPRMIKGQKKGMFTY